MEVQYKKSMGRSYVIFHEKEEEQREDYQIHIFEENSIQGLLSGKIQKINGEKFFYYDITGHQSLKNLFEAGKLGKKDLEELFLSAARVLESLEEYLLDRDFLEWNPDYIYRNMENGKYKFLWYPFLKETAEEGFLSLMEYLLPKLNHEDKEGTALGYELYQEAVEENLSPQGIREHIYRKEEQEESKGRKEILESGELQRQKILDEFYKEEPEEAGGIYSLPVSIAIVLLGGTGIFLFCKRRIFGWKGILIFFAVLLFLCGLGTAFWYSRKKRGEEKGSIEKGFIEKEDIERQFVKKNFLKKESREKEPIKKEDIEREFIEKEPEKKVSIKRAREEKERVSSLFLEEEAEGKTVCLTQNREGAACLFGIGENLGKVYRIEKKSVLIGKKQDFVDVCLENPAVSRVHAKILREEEKVYIIDLNSRNGTFLDGKELNPQEKYLLKDNAYLMFAQEKFRYLEADFYDGETQ